MKKSMRERVANLLVNVAIAVAIFLITAAFMVVETKLFNDACEGAGGVSVWSFSTHQCLRQ